MTDEASGHLLLIHSGSFDVAKTETIASRFGFSLNTLPLPAGNGYVASALEQAESLQIWSTREISLHLLSELAAFWYERPEDQVVLLVESASREEEIDALHNGAAGVITWDRIDDELPEALQRIRRRYSHLRNRDLRLALTSVGYGFSQGAARLLHDFNSPLTAIQSAFDMIDMEQQAQGKALTEDEQILKSGIESSRAISERWHDYLFTQHSTPRMLNLLIPLKRAISLAAEKKTTLHVTADPEELHPDRNDPLPGYDLQGDMFALEQIFAHVLTNALEATASLEEPEVLVRVEKLDRETAVWIEDNGPGVDRLVRETLWKDFVTTKKKPHSGMGLGIVRYLLMLHGGSIRLEEGKLGGACFRIGFRMRPHTPAGF